jgi:integrase
MHHKLTKSYIDSIPHTESGQKFYRDTEIRGFGLRVGTTAKTYFVETKVDGKVCRVTIGKHGVFAPDQARSEAKKHLVDMAKGINPNDVKAEKRVKAITLGEVFEDFLAARKSLKPRTIYDYQRMMGILPPTKRKVKDMRQEAVTFSDWQGKPVTEITKDMVIKRHMLMGTRSEAQANLAMRFLRSVFNFAMAKYEDSKGQSLIGDNPVKRLSQTKAWYKVGRRQTVIKPHELRNWMLAVNGLENAVKGPGKKREVVRDYLLLILFTGLRRREAAKLKWANVDFKSKTITACDTKNSKDHTLPLSDFLFDLLTSLYKKRTNDFIFSGEGKGGYIVEPRKQAQRVTEESGVCFTVHDLRRTFITIAESLDIPAYALKSLANHSMNNDVTAGYIIADVERLRAPMQKITDYILKCAGLRETAEIVPIAEPKVA